MPDRFDYILASPEFGIDHVAYDQDGGLAARSDHALLYARTGAQVRKAATPLVSKESRGRRPTTTSSNRSSFRLLIVSLVSQGRAGLPTPTFGWYRSALGPQSPVDCDAHDTSQPPLAGFMRT